MESNCAPFMQFFCCEIQQQFICCGTKQMKIILVYSFQIQHPFIFFSGNTISMCICCIHGENDIKIIRIYSFSAFHTVLICVQSELDKYKCKFTHSHKDRQKTQKNLLRRNKHIDASVRTSSIRIKRQTDDHFVIILRAIELCIAR